MLSFSAMIAQDRRRAPSRDTACSGRPRSCPIVFRAWRGPRPAWSPRFT